MTSNGTADGWDLIVSPWHLDEHIPAWAVPAGTTALVRPSLPAGPQLERMNLLYQAAAARYPAGPGPALARISDCVADVIKTAEVLD